MGIVVLLFEEINMATAYDIRLTGNQVIDQFLDERFSRLLPVEGNTYYWSFSAVIDPTNNQSEAVTNESSKEMVRGVLQHISTVININFKECDYSVGSKGSIGGFDIDTVPGNILYAGGRLRTTILLSSALVD